MIDYQTVLFGNLTPVVTFWIVSLLYTFYDQYNETTNQLSMKKIYNPGRRPMTKVGWDMVRLATYESFKNSIVSFIAQMFFFQPLWELRGICDSMWFENIHTTYDWFILLFKFSMISVCVDIIFYTGMSIIYQYQILLNTIHLSYQF